MIQTLNKKNGKVEYEQLEKKLKISGQPLEYVEEYINPGQIISHTELITKERKRYTGGKHIVHYMMKFTDFCKKKTPRY